MKDFFTILAEAEIEVADDKKEALKKVLNENYKTIAEFNKKVDDLKSKDEELTAKETTINELKEQIGNLEEGSKGLNELNAKLKAYEDAENERKANAAKEEKLNAIKARFSPLKKDKEYVNEYAEKGVFDDFVKALNDKANEGKSDAEIYEAITKDKNIYVNPNQKVVIPGASGGGDKETLAIEKARAIMGLKKKE